GSRVYLLFLCLLWISAFFVFLRWSNILHSPLAFFRDTPVAPGGERLSFASIFPIITLFIFSFAPLVASLFRRHRFSWRQVSYPLMAGLTVSIILALVQKEIAPDLVSQRWWAERMQRVNGGFSDFNALGFFAGLIFLRQVLAMIAAPNTAKWSRRALEATWLLVPLAGIYLSGTRSAFIFVLVAVIAVLLSREIGWTPRILFVLLLIVLFLVAGGTLRNRLTKSVNLLSGGKTGHSFAAWDHIANGRLMMIKNSLPMFGRMPLCGVGAGNFLFYLKYSRFGSGHYYEDLPLNQYLLVLDETGFPGLILFVIFFWLLFRGGSRVQRFLLLAVGASLCFNFFFWFPECMLLFFLVAACDQEDKRPLPSQPPGAEVKFAGTLILILFLLGQFVHRGSLDPLRWARETSTPYDYGFSYPEKENGRAFRWSGARAGVYIHLGADGRSGDLSLFCGAPLARLPGQRQTVDIYWRGKILRSVDFRKNERYPLALSDLASRQGFLEFRVHPIFNLKRMGLGSESRDLGVQVSGEGI
ncbi:MAG TPA: O-antigen ligase family protein, partial [Acidobacteriota bacterium]